VEFLEFLVIVSLGSLLQALTGFGFALVVVPPALVVLDRLTVVTALVVMSPALNALLIGRIRAPVDRRLIVIVLASSLAGMPLGLVVLKTLPSDPFRVLASALSILFASLLHTGRVALPQNTAGYGGTGFVSGLLQTSTTMSGPPLVMLLLSGDRTVATIRRTLAIMFIFLAIPTLALLAVTGSATRDGIVYGLAALPVVVLAGFIGHRLARRLSRARFQGFSLGMIYATGLFGIVSGLV
jgi:uncharacterized membrane protein YfcA